MSNQDKTEILIQRVQSGDVLAKNELYNRYLMRVLFFVRVRLGAKLRQKLDSWDIVQEAMLKSLQGLGAFQYHGESAFVSYLCNKVEQVICDQADHWSAQKRNPEREISLRKLSYDSSDNPLNLIDDRIGCQNVPSPAEILANNEDLQQLARTLDELAQRSPKYWEIIVAAKIEGRSYRQIAEENNSSVNAVKMMTQRAMLKLAQMYRANTVAHNDGHA